MTSHNDWDEIDTVHRPRNWKTKIVQSNTKNICEIKLVLNTANCLPWFCLTFQEPEEKIKAFLESKPVLSEFESNIHHYQLLEATINELPENYAIGTVLYATQPLKEALIAESHVWKQAYGKALANRVTEFSLQYKIYLFNYPRFITFHFLKGQLPRPSMYGVCNYSSF